MDLPTETSVNKEQRTWALCAHLSAFVGHFIPFGHILGPLVIWILKKEDMPFVGDQAKEALNFQISMTIYFAIGAVLIFVGIGLLILPVLWLFDIILVIIAAIKANDGVLYRYPATIRLVN